MTDSTENQEGSNHFTPPNSSLPCFYCLFTLQIRHADAPLPAAPLRIGLPEPGLRRPVRRRFSVLAPVSVKLLLALHWCATIIQQTFISQACHQRTQETPGLGTLPFSISAR